MPRRLAVGLDPQRLALLLAVLHRHGGVETGGYDVFVNAVGGVRILRAGRRPGGAAGRLFIIAKQAVAAKTLVFGEVGLAGEIRPVQRGQERIREAAKLGFRTVLMPSAQQAEARRSTASRSSPSTASTRRSRYCASDDAAASGGRTRPDRSRRPARAGRY